MASYMMDDDMKAEDFDEPASYEPHRLNPVPTASVSILYCHGEEYEDLLQTSKEKHTPHVAR
jgi:hypothetical protein